MELNLAWPNSSQAFFSLDGSPRLTLALSGLFQFQATDIKNKHETRAGVAELVLGDGRVRAEYVQRRVPSTNVQVLFVFEVVLIVLFHGRLSEEKSQKDIVMTASRPSKPLLT